MATLPPERPQPRGSMPIGGRFLCACLATLVMSAVSADTHPLLGRIWLPGEGQFISVDALMERTGDSRIVLVGELHGHPEHHRLQARVVEGMVHQGRRPAVLMEMLDTDQRAALMRLRAQPDASAAALGEAVGWADSGWPDWSLYLPIAEVAFAHELVLLPANLPRHEIRTFMREGGEPPSLQKYATLGLDHPLPDEAAALLRQILRSSHCDALPAAVIERMFAAQRLRDGFMAGRLIAADTGQGAVLIAGNGHVDKAYGIPGYLEREGHESLLAIGLVPVIDGRNEPADYAGAFDAMWFTTPHPVTPPDPCGPS